MVDNTCSQFDLIFQLFPYACMQYIKKIKLCKRDRETKTERKRETYVIIFYFIAISESFYISVSSTCLFVMFMSVVTPQIYPIYV